MTSVGLFGTIPYRQEAAVSFSDVGQIFLWAFMLLAATSAVFFLVKKKGLLNRWQSDVPSAPDGLAIARRGRLRISPSTVVHVLEVEGELVTVVESKSNVRISRSRK